MESATCFVRWRLRREQPELDPAQRSAIAAALRHYDGDNDNPWRRWPELQAYPWGWLACLQDAAD